MKPTSRACESARISRRGWIRDIRKVLASTAAMAILAVLQGCATNPNPYKASEYLILFEQARKLGVVPGPRPEAPAVRRVPPGENESSGDECS